MKTLVAGLMLAALTFPATAAVKTVTLSVPGMNCATCPITVKKALGKVDGVTRAEVNLEKRAAVVTFDDSRTSLEALTRATGDAGYPSTLVEDRK
ncbi:MAG: mercury resistance system periplasmic binding protein MerP [Burkholderiales bacterium]|jgi:mercuric ion binding protein|nr:mercury resistance system periplasmic binding protein MerP [Burkholderiales bacterium]MBZ0251383.1 mercury resistance system periplasmic binding protein MerP [Burkholderiales bacterium]MCC6142612.1 mercury resistance system periplasmic binding protein MerP [Candidatus Hydrogenedentota bacterium]MCL4690474.1 mercury resistance system periplasmic binding protein MerP [Burkholderiales bacterium]